MLNIHILFADLPFVGCLTVEGGRIGYCCLTAPVTYGYVSAFVPNSTTEKNIIILNVI